MAIVARVVIGRDAGKLVVTGIEFQGGPRAWIFMHAVHITILILAK